MSRDAAAAWQSGLQHAFRYASRQSGFSTWQARYEQRRQRAPALRLQPTQAAAVLRLLQSDTERSLRCSRRRSARSRNAEVPGLAGDTEQQSERQRHRRQPPRCAREHLQISSLLWVGARSLDARHGCVCKIVYVGNSGEWRLRSLAHSAAAVRASLRLIDCACCLLLTAYNLHYSHTAGTQQSNDAGSLTAHWRRSDASAAAGHCLPTGCQQQTATEALRAEDGLPFWCGCAWSSAPCSASQDWTYS